MVAVRLPDGTPGVAKLGPTGDDSRDEGEALRAWRGDGAVQLLDEHAGVLLLERAAPGTPATDDAVVAATLRRLWVAPPSDVAWRRIDALAERWAITVERWSDAIGHELADAAASGFRNALPRGEHVLLHGDGHHGNVIDGADRGWLAIDPQPLVGPRVLDLVPALFNGPEAPAAERIAVLAGVAGVDPADLRRVAVPRLVLSVAWGLDDDGCMEADERALRVARELL